MNIEALSKTSILIIGDVMLDRYWWGDVTRISPEAPVPVVRLKRDTYVPGGAANVAMNTAGLGARTILVGVIGNDQEAACIRDRLGIAGIASDHLFVSPERPTNVKTRVIAHSQQVVRVDREVTGELSELESKSIISALKPLVDSVNVILLSDYAKGTLSSAVLDSVFSIANEAGKPVIVDPKGKDFSKYRGATVLTPNRREAAESCGLDHELNDLTSIAGPRLIEDLGLNAVLITESEHGMTLFERGKGSSHFDALAKEVYDVTGAGDTVIATLAAGIGAGFSLFDAAKLANTAAGIVVQQVGTAAIRSDELAAVL